MICLMAVRPPVTTGSYTCGETTPWEADYAWLSLSEIMARIYGRRGRRRRTRESCVNAEWFAHAFTRTLAHARTTYTHARAQAHKQTNRHTWTHANKHRNTHTKSPCARVIEHKHLKNKDPYPPFRTFSSPFSLPNSIQLAEKHERLV